MVMLMIRLWRLVMAMQIKGVFAMTRKTTKLMICCRRVIERERSDEKMIIRLDWIDAELKLLCG